MVMAGPSTNTEIPSGLVLSTFNKYAVSNSDYYSVSNNMARSTLCNNKCNMDSDCMYYCAQVSYEDTSAVTDIALGNKQASQGWYPSN